MGSGSASSSSYQRLVLEFVWFLDFRLVVLWIVELGIELVRLIGLERHIVAHEFRELAVQ